jgi:hypothetical protein
MTAEKMNCLTECPLDGTLKAIFKGLLEDFRISKKSFKRQYRTSTERDPGQYRKSEEDRYRDTVDKQNTSGEGIAKQNPGAGILDGEDNIFSSYGVRLCNK